MSGYVLFSPQDLQYDRSPARAHRLCGRRVPSVTQVLRAEGLSSDFAGVDPVTLERKRMIGEAAHRAAHYYDEGDLDPGSVSPLARPYLDGWIAFRVQRGFVPLLRETVVASAYGYIGCFDSFGLVDGRRYVLADIKTGDPRDAAAHLQLAAYEQAFRETYPVYASAAIERWSVQLTADGRYRVHPYRDITDRNRFLHACRRVLTATLERGTPAWTNDAAVLL